MDLVITPEPSQEERQAILSALAEETAEEQRLTPWRAAALQAVDGSDALGSDPLSP